MPTAAKAGARVALLLVGRMVLVQLQSPRASLGVLSGVGVAGITRAPSAA